jgi:hypothetical protein
LIHPGMMRKIASKSDETSVALLVISVPVGAVVVVVGPPVMIIIPPPASVEVVVLTVEALDVVDDPEDVDEAPEVDERELEEPVLEEPELEVVVVEVLELEEPEEDP